MKHPDLNFYMVLMSLLVSGANLYLYCYYGNRSTNDFAQMAQLLYESNWNQHPVELQKFFKMMIANAQRPLFYHGFHLVQLNLETFLKVRVVATGGSHSLARYNPLLTSFHLHFSCLRPLSVIILCSKLLQLNRDGCKKAIGLDLNNKYIVKSNIFRIPNHRKL